MRCARPAATSARSRQASRHCSSSRTTRRPPADREFGLGRPAAAQEAGRTRLRPAATVRPRRRTRVTQTAPTETPNPADRRLVGVEFPARGEDGPIDGVALVTLERPEVLNALSFDLLDALADAFARLDADPSCRVIVLTGSGDR